MSALPRSIVVATDFGETADRAIAEAAELARDCDAKITIVHAYMNPAYIASQPMMMVDLVGDIIRDAEERLERTVASYRASGSLMSSVLREGPSAKVVLDVADERRADLIVVGTHGREGVRRALLGSVAEEIVRRSDRPVLVFHAARAASAAA